MNYSHNIPDNVNIDFMIGAYRVISRKHAEESNKVIDDETSLRCAILKHHMNGIYNAMLNKDS